MISSAQMVTGRKTVAGVRFFAQWPSAMEVNFLAAPQSIGCVRPPTKRALLRRRLESLKSPLHCACPLRRKIRRMTRPDQTRRHQPDRLVTRVVSSDATELTPATATPRNQQIVLRAVAVRRDRETLRRFRSIPFLCRNCIYG